ACRGALLAAYAPKHDELKAKGGYVAAGVIDVQPETPGLEAMLARFNSEHWHDEDEVRLIVDGRGLFHIHPAAGPVFAIEVEAGDLIRVPKGTPPPFHPSRYPQIPPHPLLPYPSPPR